jgi:hypothetical protein
LLSVLAPHPHLARDFAYDPTGAGRGNLYLPYDITSRRELERTVEGDDGLHRGAAETPNTGHQTVITNVPTAEDLNNVALRLYFAAWKSLIDIQPAFEMMYPPDADETEWKQEWTEYLVACQPELQSICSIISHSNELALKARICEVSPFLLLIGSDFKFGKSRADVNFSDLRTLDAVDLPAAVNTICAEPLTDKFIQSYHQMRSLRNKIAHLGQAGTSFHPDEMIGIMVSQYCELWKNRAWLQDRVSFESHWLIQDSSYVSEHMLVMQELPEVYAKLTPAQFKNLFGHSKRERRYLCHDCVYNATTKAGAPDLYECKTAFLDNLGNHVHCMMCGKDYKVIRKNCTQHGCKGTVIGDNGDDYVGVCHTCGEWP